MKSNACLLTVKLPRVRHRRVMDEVIESRYERRPRRQGQKSEARRLEEGFRILSGEGVHEDYAE